MLRKLLLTVFALAALVTTVAWAQEAADAPLVLPSAPPAGAVVLISADPASLTDNWLRRNTEEPTGWTMVDGAAEPTDRADVVSRQSFGDALYHVEFRCPEGSGNAGIGLMGRYEVQMFNSPDEEPNPTNNAAFFNQTAASRNASKPAGEWQTFDIIFRAPRFDADGNVVERARATVIHNGVVVQNNTEFQGPTGIQYGDFPGEVASAPIALQGNHDPVPMRNLWVLPL